MSDNQVPVSSTAAPAAPAATVVAETIPAVPRGLQPTVDLRGERESQTARTLALTLVWVLVGVFLLHYGLSAYLGIKHSEVVSSLDRAFNTAFPVFSGLVGTAVGFYLKERR